jgi:hypothetical protein
MWVMGNMHSSSSVCPTEPANSNNVILWFQYPNDFSIDFVKFHLIPCLTWSHQSGQSLTNSVKFIYKFINLDDSHSYGWHPFNKIHYLRLIELVIRIHPISQLNELHTTPKYVNLYINRKRCLYLSLYVRPSNQPTNQLYLIK